MAARTTGPRRRRHPRAGRPMAPAASTLRPRQEPRAEAAAAPGPPAINGRKRWMKLEPHIFAATGTRPLRAGWIMDIGTWLGWRCIDAAASVTRRCTEHDPQET